MPLSWAECALVYPSVVDISRFGNLELRRGSQCLGAHASCLLLSISLAHRGAGRMPALPGKRSRPPSVGCTSDLSFSRSLLLLILLTPVCPVFRSIDADRLHRMPSILQSHL